MGRTRWYAPGEGSDTPLDRLVDVAEATVSVGVRELCCRLTTDGVSMARTADNLWQAAQVRISEESLRLLVEREGQAVVAASESEELEPGWSASQCRTQTPEGQETTRTYMNADGVMAPVTTAAEKRKRRETALKWRRSHRCKRGRRRRKLGPVKGGADQRYKQFWATSVHDQEKKRRLVGVSRGGGRRLSRLIRREATRVRLRGARERVGLIDGAVCLRKRMERLPLSGLGLDFYHLGEHVHEAKRITFADKTITGEQWVGQVLHKVRHEGYEPFWEELVVWRGRQRHRARRAGANRLLQYVAERREMIRYEEFERRGWQIGTGPMEAMCKVTTRRVKGAGMRWDVENVEGMMALEALRQSNLWDKYWANALRNAS